MRAEHQGSDEWLESIGLLIAAPLIVLLGATMVFILATPIIVALPVVVATVGLLWVATVVTRETTLSERAIEEDQMCESADLIATLEPETIEMVDELTGAPSSAVDVSITKVFGPCPLGWMPGNAWKIGPDGKLSRPMCSPGATALSALFLMADGDAKDRSTCCECVFAGREVTFAVREPV